MNYSTVDSAVPEDTAACIPVESRRMPHLKTAARGVAITMVGALVARALSFGSQIVVGVYLSEADLGVFATALGILGVTGLLRAGGTHFYLGTMPSSDYEREAGPFFWFGLLCCTIGAVATWAVALPAQSWYGEAALGPTLFILGLQLLFNAIGQHARARMLSDMRFKGLTLLDTALAVVRLVATWFLAANAWGPLALAIPVCLSTMVETACCLSFSGIRPAAFGCSREGFNAVLPKMRWIVLLGVLSTITLQGDYLIGSLLIGASSLGLYFFAYQLASQPAMLMVVNLQSVFAPTISRLRGDRTRERLAMAGAFQGSMLFVPTIGMGMAAMFPPTEQFIWGGKWAGAKLPIYLLTVGLSYATCLAVLTGPLMGLREFRRVALLDAWRAGSVLAGAALGGLIAWRFKLDDVSGAIALAAGVGLTTGLVCANRMQVTMREFGFPIRETIHDLLFAPTLAVLAAIAADAVSASLLTEILAHGTNARLVALCDMVLTGTLYVSLSIAAARLAATPTIIATIEVLPDGVRPLARRLLFL